MPKKPKLTKEEKKERRLAKKEATRLRKIEEAKKAHNDWLAREVAYTEKNIIKIKEKWRQIMAAAKGPDFYDDFRSLQMRVEHLLDIKEGIIEDLISMLDDAEEQYNMNLRAHVETINTFIAIYASRMNELNSWYQSELHRLGNEFGKSKIQVETSSGKRNEVLEMIMFSMDEKKNERTINVQAETAAKMDEVASRGLEQIQSLKADLEAQQERQWLGMQDFVNNHLKSTSERRREVQRLVVIDKQGSSLVTKQRRLTQKAYVTIRDLRAALFTIENPPPTTLLTERNALFKTLNILRLRLEHGRARDKCAMVGLVKSSNDALQALKELASKGERIIRLANLCRRLETEDEKVLPFPEWAYGGGDEEDEGEDDAGDEEESDDYSASEDESSMSLETERHPMVVLQETPIIAGTQKLMMPSEVLGLDCKVKPRVRRETFEDDISFALACRKPDHHDKEYHEKVKKRAKELSPALPMGKTRSILKDLDPLWARVGRVTVDAIELADTVSKLREENNALKARLTCFVRMRAPPLSYSEPSPRVPPFIPVMEPPPGYPKTSKFKLLPPIETRL